MLVVLRHLALTVNRLHTEVSGGRGENEDCEV